MKTTLEKSNRGGDTGPGPLYSCRQAADHPISGHLAAIRIEFHTGASHFCADDHIYEIVERSEVAGRCRRGDCRCSRWLSGLCR